MRRRTAIRILDDPNYTGYQIRKVGEVTFQRYEPNGDDTSELVSEVYPVITAFPKKYLLDVVHDGRTFPMEDRGEYYVVDSHFAVPHIPCVTDDVIYAPIVSGHSEPTVTERGQNLGWPIQESIVDEVAKYQGTGKMWVYTTWPGYRYGYWFRDSTGIRPTWLFRAKDTTGEVTFQKYAPDAANWPEGAYNDVPYGLHVDANGKVYVPKRQPIDFPLAKDRPLPRPSSSSLTRTGTTNSVASSSTNRVPSLPCHARFGQEAAKLTIPRSLSFRDTLSSARMPIVIGDSRDSKRTRPHGGPATIA
ncbi:MAG: hypothetical protein QM784_05825 [Polyangiaceae bacterium]